MEEEEVTIQQNNKKDKFHLIRVPKGFDISKLNGVEYNPYQVVNIEAKEEKNGLISDYQLGTFGQDMDLNLLVNSENNIKVGPSMSQTLCVNRNVRLGSTTAWSPRKNLEHLTSATVSFPEGLKQRFTPFGSGTAVVHKKVKKKKSKRKLSLDTSDSSLSQRKKMHKCEEAADQNDFVSTENQQNLFNNYSKPCGSYFDTPVMDKIGKHKKRKHKSRDSRDGNEDLDSSNTGDILINGHCSQDSISKIKTEHRIDGSQSYSDDNSLSLGNDDSLSEVKVHKKKKKRSLEFYSPDNDMLTRAEDSIKAETLEEVTPKEKKRKEKKKKKDKD